MWEYLKRHEAFVRRALEEGHLPWEGLAAFHDRQIALMQHERLIHLLVTLFVALFALLAVGFLAVRPAWPVFALAVLLLGLTSAYLVHYFRLENGVQRWYHLANELQLRLGATAARYDRPSAADPASGDGAPASRP